MWKDPGGGDFEQPPVGTHVARCIKIIDIGTQKGEYQGKATFKRQVIIGWELPTELLSEGEYAGKPFTVSRFYTASLSEKANLRKDLQNWRGRDFTPQELSGFDPRNILGKCCMLSLTLNDNQKIRVTGVMALPKGMNVPEQVNPPLYFSLEPDEFKREVFDSLSDGYKKMIQISPEYVELTNPSKPPKVVSVDDLDSDIPFNREEHDLLKNMFQVREEQSFRGVLCSSSHEGWQAWQVQGMHESGCIKELPTQHRTVSKLRQRACVTSSKDSRKSSKHKATAQRGGGLSSRSQCRSTRAPQQNSGARALRDVRVGRRTCAP